MFITLGIALASGVVTGLLMKLLGNFPIKQYEDGEIFHLPQYLYEDIDKLIKKIPTIGGF